jgi:histidinol-phosphate aminotransferase
MNNQVNPNILGLNPYEPGRPVEEIKRQFNLKKVVKLASNENPFPIPKNVSKAIKREISLLNRYPDSDCFELKKKIAEYNSLQSKNIIIGAGSVEIIRMIIHAFLKPGEKVITSKNTFLMYKTGTIESAGEQAFVEAEMDSEYRYDLDNLLKRIDERTKIIFIANPNNPTGTMISKAKIIDFIKKIPEDKIIVLDNAYHEYVTDMDNYLDGIEMAINSKNLIVLKTFSKIYALAGLRIGYGITNEKIIYYLNQVKAPFNVTSLAQCAAMASLENDDYKIQSARLNWKNKENLFKQMFNLGLRVIPSETNFLFCPLGTDTQELNQQLLKEGVIIRPLHAFGMRDGIRVSIGREEENNYFIEKIRKILHK